MRARVRATWGSENDHLLLYGLTWGETKELDGDVILAAQALLLGATDVVVATTNVGHLSRLVAAERWQDVTP